MTSAEKWATRPFNLRTLDLARMRVARFRQQWRTDWPDVLPSADNIAGFVIMQAVAHVPGDARYMTQSGIQA